MYKQRVILFFSIFVSFLILTLGMGLLSIKYPRYIPNATYYTKALIVVKEHHAKTVSDQKIIIASGSNSLFGICTPY